MYGSFIKIDMNKKCYSIFYIGEKITIFEINLVSNLLIEIIYLFCFVCVVAGFLNYLCILNFTIS